MNSFLIDTNVISERVRPHPNEIVSQWLMGTSMENSFISALTLGELSRGIQRLPASRRRGQLEEWFLAISIQFGDRILAVDSKIALEWARLDARLTASGRTIGLVDGYLAATALHHDLTIVTRNSRDFEHTGVRLFNPWQ